MESTVIVKGKGATSIKDLIVGDLVLSDEDGTYSKFYSKGHYNDKKPMEFLRIYTESSSKPLELTPGHLLFKAQDNAPVPAWSIKVGDVLRMVDGPSKVTFIREISRKGLFNPLTLSGSIVVDGVVASNHNEMPGFQGQDAGWFYIGPLKVVHWHFLTHFVFAPHRVVCGRIMNCHESLNEDGLVSYGSYLWNAHGAINGKQSVIFTVAVLLCLAAQSILFSVLDLVLEHFMFVPVLGLGISAGTWILNNKVKGQK